jgi:mannosyltransferase OCH1-like enzyme
MKMKIPKILHQVWFQGCENIKPEYKKYQQSCRQANAHWEYVCWSQKQMDDFIKLEYPQLWPTYNSYPYIIQQYDFFKAVVMYHYGGVVMDMDVECLKPFDKLLENADVALSQMHAGCDKSTDFSLRALAVSGFMFGKQPIVNNAFHASVPKHPFWVDLIDEFVKRQQKNKLPGIKAIQVSRTTGIGVLTSLIRHPKWQGKITILPRVHLEPCKSKFEPCTDITSDTYAVHRFGNTWVPKWCQNVMHIVIKIGNRYEILLVMALTVVVAVALVLRSRT